MAVAPKIHRNFNRDEFRWQGKRFVKTKPYVELNPVFYDNLWSDESSWDDTLTWKDQLPYL